MLSQNTLNLLPTQSLASMSDYLTGKASVEASQLSAEKARNARLNGVIEVTTSDGGRVVARQSNLATASQKNDSYGTASISVANLAKTLVDGGVEPFVPSSIPPGTNTDGSSISLMVEELSEEVAAPDDIASTTLELEKSLSIQRINTLQVQLNSTLQTLETVNDILEKRASGELPSPILNVENITEAINAIIDDLENSGAYSAEDLDKFRNSLEEGVGKDLDYFEKFIKDKFIIPYTDNLAALNILRAQLRGVDTVDENEPIFDTVFGPPISTDGKFILSRDGIYYDSRSGSIPYITAQKIDSRSWELRYAANRGGRGKLYDESNISRFADTIFSEEFQDESGDVLLFYKYDDVLQNIINDRELQIQDIFEKIEDLKNNGYDASSAIVKNYEENYAAIANSYDKKIKKRKKQLQLAALFGPFGVTKPGDEQGEGVFFKRIYDKEVSVIDDICGSDDKVKTISFPNNSEESQGVEYSIEYIPRIPINDFSFLKDVGLIPSISSQESVVLHSSDLDDTTAPIVPIFIEKGPGAFIQSIPELSIAPLGTADWVNTSGNTDFSSIASSTVEDIAPYLRTLDDSIVTDNLVVCYNFFEPDAVTTPDSSKFGVRNYSDYGTSLNAKLVGDADSIFVSGVSIPFLEGSLFHPGEKYGVRYSYLPKGSYVRLPNNFRDGKPYPASQPIDNLMYSRTGWSMDFWVYAPELSSGMTTDHRYKLVAANENCGDPLVPGGIKGVITGSFTTADPENFITVDRKTRTKGMVIGWRDRGEPGTPQASGLEFVVLPTVAQNDPLWGKSVAIAEAVSGMGSSETCRVELGFKVDLSKTTKSGYTIQSAETGFTHYSLVCDHTVDAISLYVNGEFLASSTVSSSFNLEPGIPLNTPSRISPGHFHDESGRFGEKLYSGDLPETPIFTPWILGGGFTDGISDSPFVSSFGTTFPGFLGTNTNSSYFATAPEAAGGPIGQHSVLGANPVPGLGGYSRSGVNYKLARSGLQGHLGSFKLYSKPLSNTEVLTNFKAQSPYFMNIKIPKRLI